MSSQVTFSPATAYALDALGEIFTRSFENYLYPMTLTGAILAARARTEQIDLQRSLVMRVGDDPVGIALLGLRGERAWCGRAQGLAVAGRVRRHRSSTGKAQDGMQLPGLDSAGSEC